MTSNKTILITGGTGYVGGRLIPMLLDGGYSVRAMVRSPQKLLVRLWARHPDLNVLPGDALDQASFTKAGKGCNTAYYLIHSMNAHKGRFAEADRKAAQNMVACAERNGMLPIHDWLFKGVLMQIAHKYSDSLTGPPDTFPVEKELECKL